VEVIVYMMNMIQSPTAKSGRKLAGTGSFAQLKVAAIQYACKVKRRVASEKHDLNLRFMPREPYFMIIGFTMSQPLPSLKVVKFRCVGPLPPGFGCRRFNHVCDVDIIPRLCGSTTTFRFRFRIYLSVALIFMSDKRTR
jgi:hypothetical protein